MKQDMVIMKAPGSLKFLIRKGDAWYSRNISNHEMETRGVLEFFILKIKIRYNGDARYFS
jgi:hypothetical protein